MEGHPRLAPRKEIDDHPFLQGTGKSFLSFSVTFRPS